MLSQRLKYLRGKHLTQAQMADRIGVARTTYAMYEQGHREPDNKTLTKIADYFGVSTDYLLGRSDDPTPPKHIQAGIPDDEYQALSDYQKEVLNFMLNSETLAFSEHPENILEVLEEFEIYYEIKKRQKEKRRGE